MMIPYPSPRRSFGGGLSGPAYITRQNLPIGDEGATHLTWTESAITSKEALYALVTVIDPTIPLSAVHYDWLTVGSGGGGGSGSGATGGLGAAVQVRSGKLIDVADGDIAIDIAQGGAAGMNGFYTSITASDDFEISGAQGGNSGFGGSTARAETQQLWLFGHGSYIDFADPTLTTNDWGAPSSKHGPGCGGRLQASDETWTSGAFGLSQLGGNGCNADPWMIGGGFNGGPGFDADNSIFLSCGGGGSSNPSGAGGNGGLGGGGGGAGSTAGGVGGNGLSRLRLWIESIS
ncbi:glycine-rich domain-containing protein [Rhizobium sp. Z1P35]